MEEGVSEWIFWDDVTGEQLEGWRVREARNEEMKEVWKHGIYEKVPIQQCWDRTGKGPIGTRWVDINKGDRWNPEYRSRLVAMEFNTDKRNDLFAAPPRELDSDELDGDLNLSDEVVCSFFALQQHKLI